MRSKRSKNIDAKAILDELAARNVRKSAKDYFIYFFTLMLSVCLFYSFNSVSTQFASLGLEDQLNMLTFSSGVLTAFSVVVCFIMGALVVYANRFLLRRRKKEMGIYATLGMSRKDLNRILMKETFRIGLISLATGIVLGIFAAQILSLITAKIAGLSLSSYRFMISGKAIFLSLLFFGILFYFVHLFHIKELKKMSLLEMLYAERKNENAAEGKNNMTVLFTVCSVLLMLGGYAVIFREADQGLFKALGIGGGMLIAGTVLFFSSAFKMMARMMKKRNQTYFQGLNMFTAGQFSSRLKTEGRSAGMISILLFLALSLTILGPGIGKHIMNGIEYANPFDGTLFFAPETSETYSGDPMEYLIANDFQVSRFSDAAESFWTYADSSVTAEFLEGDQAVPDEDVASVTMIGIDDFNRIRLLRGQEPVVMGENEFGIAYAFPVSEKALHAFQKNPRKLNLGGMELSLAENGVYHYAWENSNVIMKQETIIIPQKLTNGLTPERWILNFNFSGDRKEANKRLYESWFTTDLEGFQLQEGQQAVISITADHLLTTYLGIYLGITFLITAGAVLTIQQLSQSSDNVKRYSLLRKLGASKEEMRRSLTKQLGVYFGLPMAVAAIHSAVIAALVFRYFEGLSFVVMLSIIVFGSCLIFAVYGVYFMAAYLGSRRVLQL